MHCLIRIFFLIAVVFVTNSSLSGRFTNGIRYRAVLSADDEAKCTMPSKFCILSSTPNFKLTIFYYIGWPLEKRPFQACFILFLGLTQTGLNKYVEEIIKNILFIYIPLGN
jgi:hypothetical protein